MADGWMDHPCRLMVNDNGIINKVSKSPTPAIDFEVKDLPKDTVFKSSSQFF